MKFLVDVIYRGLGEGEAQVEGIVGVAFRAKCVLIFISSLGGGRLEIRPGSVVYPIKSMTNNKQCERPTARSTVAERLRQNENRLLSEERNEIQNKLPKKNSCLSDKSTEENWLFVYRIGVAIGQSINGNNRTVPVAL